MQRVVYTTILFTSLLLLALPAGAQTATTKSTNPLTPMTLPELRKFFNTLDSNISGWKQTLEGADISTLHGSYPSGAGFGNAVQSARKQCLADLDGIQSSIGAFAPMSLLLNVNTLVSLRKLDGDLGAFALELMLYDSYVNSSLDPDKALDTALLKGWAMQLGNIEGKLQDDESSFSKHVFGLVLSVSEQCDLLEHYPDCGNSSSQTSTTPPTKAPAPPVKAAPMRARSSAGQEPGSTAVPSSQESSAGQEAAARSATWRAHFNEGASALVQAESERSGIARSPAYYRATLEQEVRSDGQTAIAEFRQAERIASPTNPNMSTILANLGKAYEITGDYGQAAATIQKAIALKPDQASYYVALSSDQARLGKLPDAEAACGKLDKLDAASAGACWRNVGIARVDATDWKTAADAFERATQVDPNNSDGWYLLGSSFLAALAYRQTGSKIRYVVQPGTAEAYEKYLKLAPKGLYAISANNAVSELTSIKDHPKEDAYIDYNLGLTYFRLVPAAWMDGFWSIARAITLKVPKEQQVRTYLRQQLLVYQQPGCRQMIGDELDELLQLAGTNLNPPASFTIPSTDELNAIRKKSTILSAIASLQTGGQQAKSTWLALCGTEFQDIPGKVIGLTREPDAEVIDIHTGATPQDIESATTPNVEVDVVDEPAAARIRKGDAIRISGTVVSYDAQPFLLHLNHGKVNPADIRRVQP